MNVVKAAALSLVAAVSVSAAPPSDRGGWWSPTTSGPRAGRAR
jgi:hypothetical protein